MFNLTRRQALATSGGILATLLPAPQRFATAAAGNTLNIAYNVNLPSFNPDAGPLSVNPTIQAMYRSIFDQYIGQKPNLAFEPGLLTAWGLERGQVQGWMDVRKDVVWHDGSPFTPEDVVWSLQHEADAKNGNMVAFVWQGIGNYEIDGQRTLPTSFISSPTCSSGLPSSPVMSCRKKLLGKSGSGRFREKADRYRPVHGRCL